MRTYLTVLCLTLLVAGHALPASGWTGYINDRSSPGEQYGYMDTTAVGADGGKLRITCYPPQGFRLYIDERTLGPDVPSRVEVTVDSLTTLGFQLARHGPRFFVSDQSPGFWELIAQMIAGRIIHLQLSDTQQYRYGLSGFTGAFKSHCGWMETADNYRAFIARYR